MLNFSQIDDATLTTLIKDNVEYKAIEQAYHKKIETSNLFLTQEEFLQQEIERIKTVFIRPIIIHSESGNIIAEFNYSKYISHAYEWLSMGNDWSLKQIIFSAKQSYLQKYPPDFCFNEEEFSNAIIQNLSTGVALLLYEKFLKEELKKIKGTGIEKITVNKKRKRKQVPRKIIALLQKEIRSTCPFCNNKDVDHFQIHHIDENPNNNIFINLLMLCPLCHSKITKGDILVHQVVEKKKSLFRS